MKKGFQLEIQKDLTEDEMERAIEECNDFIWRTVKDNMTFCLGGKSGGWSSYLVRGTFGYMISSWDDNNVKSDTGLVFRRCSCKKRIFGVFRENELVVKHDYVQDEETELKEGQDVPDMCVCPEHRGGIRVKWRNEKPKTIIYATIGEIKG